MSRGCNIIALCLTILSPCIGIAQEPQALWFHSLTAKQGLAQSFNWNVYHDSQGFVWISSTAGLNRFDGLKAKQYLSNPQDTSSLLDENIYSGFFEDNKTNLWFSTYEAVHCYIRKHDRFQRFFIYNQQKKAVPGPYKVHYLEQDSMLWVTADSILYRLNIHQPRQTADIVAVTKQFKCRMELDENGAVQKIYAFGMIPGLEIYTIQRHKAENSVQATSTRKVVMPDEFVREVWPEHQNRIWVSSNTRGLFSFDPTVSALKFSASYFPGMAVSFTHWKERQIILAVRGKGIFILDTGQGKVRGLDTRFIGTDETALNSIKGIYCDRSNNLWLTDESAGLYFANLFKTKFSSIPKLRNAHVNAKYSYWSMQEDQGGNIWIGTCPAGVFLLNKDRELIQHFRNDPDVPNSLPSNWVRALIIDNDNRVYVGTSVGVAKFEPSNRRFELLPAENGKKELLINHLMRSSSGRIFASAELEGIYEIVQRKTGAVLVEMIPAQNGAFQTIFEGPDQTLYCSKSSQQIDVYSFKNGPFQLLDSIPVKGLINGYFENKTKGTHFFGSSNGLVKLEATNSTAVPTFFTEADGLPGKNIVGLLRDDDVKLWLGTNMGIAYYAEPNHSFRAFSLADGMQSTEFHLTAALKLRNGELWFGGAEGITIVPKNGLAKDIETLPKILITRIEINDQVPGDLRCHLTGASNCTEIQQLVLPYGQNTISFEFAALEYSDPENNRFRYKLEGLDDHWVEVKKGQPHFARYPNLRHGVYAFWLQASNSDGKWAPQQKMLSLTIKPPWYLTWWFLSLAALLTLFLLYHYYLSRIAKARKEAELKQLQAELKQRAAEAKLKLAETETAILRLQMNPHFIFNSMNSINAYIHKKDIDTASDYLTRFATLMRKILNLAAKTYISIADEIDFLEQYLKTEAMRFEKKFDYLFEVDSSIDAEDVVVPTMILQPFVENAIWHGLVKKAGTGTIKICFAQQEGVLICTVEDNGIGREAARKVKDGGSLGHESKALSITARRLKLLEAEFNVPSGYEFIDMIDTDGAALGTKVVIRLPLL